MNRIQRRQASKRSRGMLISASLAAGSLFGYVGYTRPAFASTGACSVSGNVGTVSGGDNTALVQSLTDCLTYVSSGGTINFDVPQGTQIDVSTRFSITKDLTIQGSSTTDAVWPVFDGGNTGSSGSTSGLFTVADGLSVTFAELGLANSSNTSSGGAVAVRGIDSAALSFDSVKISGNTSGGSYAGAVYNVNGDVRVTSMAAFKTVVSDNKGVYGGAVAANSMYVADSSFLNNEAYSVGGAIYMTNNGDYTKPKTIGDLDVKRSSFIGNNSDGFGGAIFSLLGNTHISYTVFEKNVSASSGGGALVTSSSNVTINNSQFANNAADSYGYGGAIYAYGSGTFEINDSLFESNVAYEGGAVDARVSDGLSVNRSTFYSNSASVRAGAIMIQNGSNATNALLVENSTFYRNEARVGSAVFHFYGASQTPAVSEFNFSTIYKNYDLSNSGYAAIMGRPTTTGTISNSIIAGNSNANDPSSTADFETKLTSTFSLTSADGPIGLSPVFLTDATLGEVFSHLLPLSNSQALDAADPSADLSTSLATDQLGNTRTATANIGAVDTFGYQISTSAGANGSISPAGDQVVGQLSDNTFTVTPDADYQIATVTVDGSAQSITDASTFNYTFNNVSQNHSIAATFEPITHTITVTQGENGTISPSTSNVNQGSNETFTVTPGPNYVISSVTVDGTTQTITDSSSFSYTFTGVNAPGTISATFEAIPSSSFSAPAPTTQPILIISGADTYSAGDEVTAEVQNWRDSARIFIGGVEAEFVQVTDNQVTFTVPELEAGSYAVVTESDIGKVTALVNLVVTESSISAQQALNVWTKKISDTEAKVYAKNPIGNGKIQFFVNGEEIAWIRAEDSDDPKLRGAQGNYYLVRTVELTDSKQAIEIYVDGVRAWRAAYTATS